MDRSAPVISVSVLPDPKAVEGRRPAVLDGRVMSFSYEDNERKADRGSLTIWNHDMALFEAAGDDILGGDVIEVAWGYAGQMSPPRRLSVKKLTGSLTLTVEALALSAELDKVAKTRVWHNTTRSDVAIEIAREYGYEGAWVEVDDTEEIVDTVTQAGWTDAQFLRRLARAEGFEFWVDDTGLHLHSRRLSAAPTHVLHWFDDPGRGDVISWGIESDLVRRVGRAQVKGRDPKTKKDIDESSDQETADRSTTPGVVRSLVGETGATAQTGAISGAFGVFDRMQAALHPTTAKTPKAAKRQAATRIRRAEREAVKLSMTIVGDPTMRAKTMVDVRGISTMFSGLYYVASCVHRISSTGYRCELKLLSDTHGRLAAKIAAEQGGKVNRQKQKPPDEPLIIQDIDDDSGRRLKKYAWPGGAASSDPEAKN